MEKTNKRKSGAAEASKKRAKNFDLPTPLRIMGEYDLREALTSAIRDGDEAKLDLWVNLVTKEHERGIYLSGPVYCFEYNPAHMPELTLDNIPIVHIIVVAIKFGALNTLKYYYWYLTTKWIENIKAPMMSTCDALGIVLFYALRYKDVGILKWARQTIYMGPVFDSKSYKDVLMGVCSDPQLNEIIYEAIDEKCVGLIRYLFEDLHITWAPGVSYPHYPQVMSIGKAISTGSEPMIELIKKWALPLPEYPKNDISKLLYDGVDFSQRLGKASTDQIAYVMDTFWKSFIIQPSIYYDAVENGDFEKVHWISKHVGTFGEDHSALLGDLKHFTNPHRLAMFESRLTTRLEVIDGIWGHVLLSGSTEMFHTIQNLFGKHSPRLRLLYILTTMTHHADKINEKVLSLMVPNSEEAICHDWTFGEADNKQDHRYDVLKEYIDRAFEYAVDEGNWSVANWILRTFDTIIWHD